MGVSRARLLLVIALLMPATVTLADEALLMRQNLGLLLDAPFLHQDTYPTQSVLYDGDDPFEIIAYEMNAHGMPVIIDFTDPVDGYVYASAGITYRADGQIESLVYFSLDPDGVTFSYRDVFAFDGYGPTGPLGGVVTTVDGSTANLVLRYDQAGRLIELREEDPYAPGEYRTERYAWAELEGRADLPIAVEYYYEGIDLINRYFLLYDATGRLLEFNGNEHASDEEGYEPEPKREVFVYSTGTFDRFFGTTRERRAE